MRGLEKCGFLVNISDLGFITGSQAHFDKYITQLREGDRNCPLCHRAFSTPEECCDLIDELDSQIKLIPRQINKKTVDLDSQRELYNRLQQLMPSKDIVTKLTNDLTLLRDELTLTNEDMNRLKLELEECSVKGGTLQRKKELAGTLLSDLSVLNQLSEETAALSRDIKLIEQMHAKNPQECNLDDLSNRKSSLEHKLAQVRNSIDGERNKIQSTLTKMSDLKLKIAQLQNERFKIVGGGAVIDRLRTERDELEKENVRISGSISQLQSELARAESVIESVNAERDFRMGNMNRSIRELEKKIQAVESGLGVMRDLSAQIDQYDKEGRPRFVMVSQQIELNNSELSMIRNERSSVTSQIDALNYELSNYDTIRHSLTENIRLKETEDELARCRIRLESFKSPSDERRKLDIEIGDISRQVESSTSEVIQLGTRLDSVRNEVTRMQQTLKRDFSNAETEYRVTLASLRVCENVCQDLDVFYKMLDQCVGLYHREKMNELNKIIRELWRSIYKGNDIDCIELRYEVESAGGATEVHKRRNFNYRVVMLKGDRTMDMRGRCSAGQKILASLIIRLALAESFCVNCGILALDEPTSNLDSSNIEGLAYALNEILSSRHGQSNFQLIVITHDEEFVELLSRTGHCDSFYRVSKDSRGYSVIESANIGDLRRL